MRRARGRRQGARGGRWLGPLALLALLAAGAAPAATVASADARPCAANPLCLCRGDHFACDDIPLYRFPETEAGARHVALSGAQLAALGEAALAGRALRTLLLAGARLSHVDGAALASMTASLASLDLGYNELTEVPGAALRSLKVLNWLNLQNNYIAELDPVMDWGGLADSLSTLSLTNNHISVIHEGALASLRRLVRLELDGNRLRRLAAAALPPALAALRLSDNLLSDLPCGTLRLLPRLRHLHLRNNLIKLICNVTCQNGRSKIDSLDLSHNELADNSRFESYHNLQLKRLILDLNDFTAVPSFVLNCGRLEKLSMSYNKLQRVSDAALRVLKQSLERLELDHNELTALPRSLRELVRLRHLSLAYNLLEDVRELPPRLHTLSLAGNFLTTLPASLRDLQPASLNYLDLGYNRISHVVAEHFDAWSGALTALILRGNRLAQLTAGSFPPLPLRELVLSFNDLHYVESGAFSNLTDLKVLELSSALLSGKISTGWSAGALTWLTLDNNDLRFIPTDDMLKFPLLEYLNLDFNKIAEFPSGIGKTSETYKLKELRMSYNYISRLSSEFLEGFTELQNVDLSNNRLRNISEKIFSNLRNLVYLNLAGNAIETISEGAFSNLPKIEILDLQENSLVEFSSRCFVNVSNADTGFVVNVSHNRIATLSGGSRLSVDVLDLSHNLLETVPREFLMSFGEHARQIILSQNKLLSVDTFATGAPPAALNILNLQKNNIKTIERRDFSEMPALQILDLSSNRIEQLTAEQFHSSYKLRVLRLDGNRLRALPRNAFENTALEYLDLSDNRLALFPSSAVAPVGPTLRRLELSRNKIEYLDVAMFRSAAFLHELGLSRNALTVLSDNALAGLPRLRRLDLSFNTIKTNFKELFYNVPSLRRLSLEGVGLRAAPRLPLANLTELELGGNHITSYGASDARHLRGLRALGLAGNALAALRSAAWAALPHLVSLDVSRNPIVRLRRGSLEGLGDLLHLRMDRLRQLEAVDPRAFCDLPSLRSLALESPAGNDRELPVAEIVSAAGNLEALALRVRRETLDAQLKGLRAPKLRELVLRGAALRRLAPRALAALGAQRALAVRLAGSGVARLPAELLAPLARVPLLALDLSDNRLVDFDPAALYSNETDRSRFATKLLSGGLLLAGNPLPCGCSAAWAGAWLRRWSSVAGGGRRPLPGLSADEVQCGAGALSGRSCGWAAPGAAALLLVLAAACG